MKKDPEARAPDRSSGDLPTPEEALRQTGLLIDHILNGEAASSWPHYRYVLMAWPASATDGRAAYVSNAVPAEALRALRTQASDLER